MCPRTCRCTAGARAQQPVLVRQLGHILESTNNASKQPVICPGSSSGYTCGYQPVSHSPLPPKVTYLGRNSPPLLLDMCVTNTLKGNSKSCDQFSLAYGMMPGFNFSRINKSPSHPTSWFVCRVVVVTSAPTHNENNKLNLLVHFLGGSEF